MNYYDNLLKCINSLDNGIEVKENIRCLINIASSTDDCEKWIIKIIKENSVNKVILLNYIAVNLYKSGIYNSVIPLLENALKYDFNNDNTLYNMGYILYKLNENQLALNSTFAG